LNRNIKKILRSKDDPKTKVIIKSIRLYRKFGYHEHEDSKDLKNRNFLSYVDRAERIFGPDERVNVVKARHIQMIRKKMRNHERRS